LVSVQFPLVQMKILDLFKILVTGSLDVIGLYCCQKRINRIHSAILTSVAFRFQICASM
jgi:hypothetical protein